MLYYRVKPEHDNNPKINRRQYFNCYKYKSDIWIKNELYTQTEIQRMENNGIIIDYNMFDIVTIPKNKIYFFFGARFAEV